MLKEGYILFTRLKPVIFCGIRFHWHIWLLERAGLIDFVKSRNLPYVVCQNFLMENEIQATVGDKINMPLFSIPYLKLK